MEYGIFHEYSTNMIPQIWFHAEGVTTAGGGANPPTCSSTYSWVVLDSPTGSTPAPRLGDRLPRSSLSRLTLRLGEAEGGGH